MNTEQAKENIFTYTKGFSLNKFYFAIGRWLEGSLRKLCIGTTFVFVLPWTKKVDLRHEEKIDMVFRSVFRTVI